MTDNKTSVSVNPAGALIASAIPSTETPLLLAGVNGNEDHFRTNLLTHVTPVLPGQLSLDQSSSNPTRATRASSLAQIGSSPATVAVTSNSIDPSLSGGKFPPKNMTSNSVPTLANLVTSSPQLNPHNGNHGGHQADTSMVDSESQPVLKKTSFQITSVTTIDSSASNDGGDESGDDLDESHTEDSSDVPSDVSSRHTSESRGGTVTNLPGNPAVDENFTRNDVFFNPSPVSAMGTAPVIPTSAQYGLAVVSLPHSENPNNSNPNGLTTVEDIPNFASSTETSGQVGTTTGERSEQERDHVHNRFKVVKIESTEPFRKGRWMCMDYVDHTNTTLTPTLTTAGTNRISVASTSQNPTQLTHGTTSHTSEVNSLPQQIQSNHSLSPPQIHQQQMIQTHLIGGDSVVQHQQQQQLIQQQMNVMHQQQPPAQIQMVPSTNEIPHGGDTHGLLNGTPSYQHLTHMNLNPHVINISGIDYSNPQQQTQSSQNVNTNQNLFQSTQPQATQQQQQQKQCYGNQSNLIQGPMDAQQGQPFQQQPMDSQQTHPHSVSIPVQQLSQQYSHAPPANQQNQQPLMQQQQQHPGQSLPHGAVSVVTVNQLNTVNPAQQQQQQMATSVANPTSTAQQQQVTQSLGHAHNIQIQKQAFISTGTAQQQPTNPTHFQNQQELSIGQSVPQMGVPAQQQTNYGQQQTQQQPQPQQQQGNMMMSGLPPIHQQQQHHIQHVQPMQVQVPQQSQQPVSQNPAMYTQQPQMQLQSMQMQSQQQQQPGGLPMAGQGQIINQTQHIPQLSQQQFATQQMHPLIQNQQQQQPSPQQMMSIAGQQSMVSQPQQQGMMNPQMMNQGMQPQQGGQMSGMMSQGHQPQQIIGQTPSGVIQQAQQPLLQTLQQSNYQPQQQQNINTQQMPQQQQPIVHQTFQGQAQTMVPHQQMMSTPQQPTMIQQPQMNQQQQGMGSNLQQPQQTHSVHQLQGQNQMGMVVGGGQQPQYQPQPTQVQQQQPTNLVTNIQQSAVHPTSSTNQMGLPLNSGSSIPMINNAMGAATVSTAEMLSLGLQQQQPLSTASSLPPLGVNVSDSQLIQQQVTSLPVPPLLPGVDTTSGPPGGDTSSAPSTFTSQARMLLEESVVASDEGDSTSGTSTVAIDNKIEQAMDLVKSHLMFAVREEVEVLKERIAELMERINHLEYENTILRTNASAETLAQLQQSTTSAKSINPSNPNTNS